MSRLACLAVHRGQIPVAISTAFHFSSEDLRRFFKSYRTTFFKDFMMNVSKERFDCGVHVTASLKPDVDDINYRSAQAM